MPDARGRVIPSPNIWNDPDTYELENRGVDPEGLIERTILRLHGLPEDGGFADLDVLDVGCGAGFHLPRLARGARSVTGVEPHPPLVARARERLASLDPGMPQPRVIEAGAESIPLPDNSIDLVHARWAYFFGPGCEPGITELERVVRPGGAAYVIDNDATASTFGAWFSSSLPAYDARAVERFWARRGWERERLTIRWQHETREDFERVVGIEFAPEHAARILMQHPGIRGVDYAINLWHRRF